jgi:hypothetical protein
MSWIVQVQLEFKHKRDAERAIGDLRHTVFDGCGQVRISDTPRTEASKDE